MLSYVDDKCRDDQYVITILYVPDKYESIVAIAAGAAEVDSQPRDLGPPFIFVVGSILW